MKKQDVVKVSGAVFGIIALVHLLRLIRGWEANIAGWNVPIWLSGVAVVVAGYLAYSLWKG